MEQMVDKAITAITETGLYQVAILEWNSFDAEHMTWPELKAHFTEVYDLPQRSGAGTATDHGYHQGNNTLDIDDDSLGSIKTSITSIHQAHNVNAVAMNENISAITAESTRQKDTIAIPPTTIGLTHHPAIGRSNTTAIPNSTDLLPTAHSTIGSIRRTTPTPTSTSPILRPNQSPHILSE